MAGGLISKGLQYIGQFLSKRVDQSKPINVTPETRLMIEKSVGKSKNFLDLSTEKFAGLFRMAVNEAMKL